MTAPTGVVGDIRPTAEPDTSKTDAAPTPAATAAESRLTRPLPTDRLTFANQISLLRAYAVASGPDGRAVTNADLAKLVDLTASSVGLNNSFFAGVGLITKSGSGYVPCAEVVSFNRSFGFSPDTAPHRLAPALRRTWFGSLLLPRLSMRPMSEQEALAELANAASATQEQAGRLRTLLEYLTTAALIERDGTTIRLGQTGREGDEPRREEATVREPAQATADRSREQGATPSPNPGVATTFASATQGGTAQGGISLNVAMNINLAEMATWRPEAVQTFMEGLARVIAAKAMVERDASR